MSTDLPVIYFAATIEEADIVVNWLAERGFSADVKDRNAAGTMEVRTIPSPAGIEVCVLEPTQADAARALLLQEFTELDEQQEAKADLGPADATCEDCGETATYSAKARGRVESCPKCGAYVDVPS